MVVEGKPMTEAQWRADGTKMKALLAYVRPRASDHKRGLFAAACCRQVWHLLKDQRSRAALQVVEHFAEGSATLDELSDAEGLAMEADMDVPPSAKALRRAASAVYGATCDNSVWDFAEYTAGEAAYAARIAGGPVDQMSLLRCIFGNPFRPAAFDPTHRTSAVVSPAPPTMNGNCPAASSNPTAWPCWRTPWRRPDRPPS
jgi:hypothetical protein